ncbi:TetR/AcrR family transcriptional regulator [Nocardioides aurantiacus]|uniref:TetR family transcriptional regulator n=1 Tax=Nocardioides aurantiacus TaxID=86796 RepID=A0A3N2CV33_9ACTN|nr:TetR/AcrR family transcriptional regulator [Nocardioides aurantiacus]ROR91084.1 TetR family transcriptional regulator [Nocardioides aurantiacus]
MPPDTDPRTTRSRKAITAATRRLLLEHGPAAVTHVRVAEASGVGRATVYRHWPRSDQLLAEAMAAVPMPFFDTPPDRGTPTVEWVRAELTSLARQLGLPDVRAVTTTLANAALWDMGMDARRSGFAHLLAQRLSSALHVAQERGEVTLSSTGDHAAALAIGPLYYRATIEHAPIDEHLIQAAIDALGTWHI